MSLYAIGDIHGCFDALETLFHKIPRDRRDTYVFLGDYVDKGPRTKDVIEWLIERNREANTVFLKGNHEIMMLRARDGHMKLTDWLAAGGKETLESYHIKPDKYWAGKINSRHWYFIESCFPYHKVNDTVFVHAGLEPELPLSIQSDIYLFWKKFKTPVQYKANQRVICGHTARKDGFVANFDHTICLDTYAYGGQWLSALNIDNLRFYQANEERKYRYGHLSHHHLVKKTM